ncbi:hypothetical protein UP17_05205 [Peribacillus simplex]|nr:hypothetical protein UP17_05205 [Peribacillus simplex]
MKRKVRDPAGASRGRTAHGKGVPYVPINVQIVQAIKKRRQTQLFIEFVNSLRPMIIMGLFVLDPDLDDSGCTCFI